MKQSEILQAVRAYRGAFVAVGVFSMVLNLLLLVPSIYMLQVYDRVIPSRNETTLALLTLMMVGLYALSGLIEWVRSRLVVQVGRGIDQRLAARTYEAAFRRSLAEPGQPAGQAVNDLTAIRQFLTGSALFALFDAPWFPLYLAVIFVFDPALGWLASAGTLVLVLLAVLNERLTGAPMREASQAGLASERLATNALRNAEVIHAMGMLESLRARWALTYRRLIDHQSQSSDRAAAVGATSRFVRLTEQSLVLGLGAALVLRNDLTSGMMVAASILSGRALAPVDQLIASWRQWASARGAWRRLDELLSRHPAQAPGLALPSPSGRLSVCGVSLRLAGRSQEALRQVSLELNAGEVLGVVGASGSGKSSLARVMLGLWPASEGTVRLDGADILHWPRVALGPSLGYLPQDVELFAGTVAENIARFDAPDAQAVVRAARLAGVHELVLQLPKGYDTALGEGGAGLSAGQRQRIALARAVYGSPRLVILDEPNSNLDDAGELALAQAVRSLREAGCTVVLMTHRPAILAMTDKLLVLREGAVQLWGPRAKVIEEMARVNAHQQAAAQAARAGAQGSPHGAMRVPALPSGDSA